MDSAKLIFKGLLIDGGVPRNVPVDVLYSFAVREGIKDLYCVSPRALFLPTAKEIRVADPAAMVVVCDIAAPAVRLEAGIHICTWSGPVCIVEFDTEFLIGEMRKLNPRAKGLN